MDATIGCTPMTSVLRTVGSELEELERAACRLQDTVGSLVERSGCRDLRTMEDMQALDLLVQRLSGLGGFLHALVPSVSPEWRADAIGAAQAVPLSDLAGRLGGMGGEDAVSAKEEAGTLDLF